MKNDFPTAARSFILTEWKGGNRLWVIDLVVPFGGEEGFVKDLLIGPFFVENNLIAT